MLDVHVSSLRNNVRQIFVMSVYVLNMFVIFPYWRMPVMFVFVSVGLCPECVRYSSVLPYSGDVRFVQYMS